MGFDDIKGIAKNKEQKSNNRDTTNLERMIGITEQAIKKMDWVQLFHEIDLIKDSVKDSIRLNLDDIKDYVAYYSDNNLNMIERLRLGYLSGEFVNIYKKMQKEGTNVRIDMDGKGKKFDVLFHSVVGADELILRNYKGESIANSFCENANGNKMLALLNMSGTLLAEKLGNPYHKIEDVVLIGNDSGVALSHPRGNIDLLIVTKNKFDTFANPVNYFIKRCYINNLIMLDNDIKNSWQFFKYNQIDNAIVMNNNIDVKECTKYQRTRIERGYWGVRRKKAEYVAGLARELDTNNTERMISQIYQIKTELGLIK